MKKVLWTVNLIPSEAAEQLNINTVVLGGWVESMTRQLREYKDIQLAIACKCGENQKFSIEVDGVRYYSIHFDSKIVSKEDIENIFINHKGRIYRFKDLCRIVERPAKQNGWVRSGDAPAVTLAITGTVFTLQVFVGRGCR